MEKVLQNQSHKRPNSLWKRIIRDHAHFRTVRKISTHEDERENNTKDKGMKKYAAKNDQLHQQDFQERGYFKNIEPTQKIVIRGDENADSDNACRTTAHISTHSPESSRRNAICEVIEKQCVDHVRNHEVNLFQRRDYLRVEYVLREVCLL
jgi:hypothetical protein